jgi:hypothetical protein
MGLIPFWGIVTSTIKNKNKRRKILSLIIFIQIFLISALRSPLVSYDTQTYLMIFNRVKGISFFDFTALKNATTVEIGFSYLNKLLSYVSMNNQFYIISISFLILFLVKQGIDKQSKNIWLSYYLLISLGFYTSFMSMLRQSLAMAIVMLAYNYLDNDNKKKFILLVVIGFTIHQTAAIFLVMFFFINRRITNKSVLVFLLAIPVVYLFSDKILGVFFSFTKYGYRAQRAISGEGQALLLVYIIVFIAALIFKKNILKRDALDSRLYYIAGFSILCQLLALEFSLFSRVALYFSLFQIILIPNVISSISNSKARIIGIFLVVVLTPVLLYVNLNKNLGGVVPYLFYWQ